MHTPSSARLMLILTAAAIAFISTQLTTRFGRPDNKNRGQAGSVFEWGYWSAIYVRGGDAWKIRMLTLGEYQQPAPFSMSCSLLKRLWVLSGRNRGSLASVLLLHKKKSAIMVNPKVAKAKPHIF